jgi:hypothetical protein
LPRRDRQRDEQRRREVRREKLRAEASRFAEEMSTLLNCTVCDGIRLTALIERTEEGDYQALVGYKLDEVTLVAEAIPVSIGRRAATVYLSVHFRLDLDPERDYLRVAESVLALALDKDRERLLFHYDFERDKEGYPEAHVQVCAESPDWNELCRHISEVHPDRDEQVPERLHLPVGGRRYRPSLEDIIEFLIDERIVATPDHRTDAKEVLRRSRETFSRIQLRAAVRNDPETALGILVEMGLATRADAEPERRKSRRKK